MPVKQVDKQAIAGRLEKLMHGLGFENQREWSFALGYDRPDNLYNATSGERMPGIPLLVDISNTFDNANIGWILTGKGNMLYDVLEKNTSGPSQEPDENLLTQILNNQNKHTSLLEEIRSNLNRNLSAQGGLSDLDLARIRALADSRDSNSKASSEDQKGKKLKDNSQKKDS